jgi:uncharacterized protein YjbJ (UPF0337 family)
VVWNNFGGVWLQLRGKAHGQWGRLIDDAIEVARGEKMEREGRMRMRADAPNERAPEATQAWNSHPRKS